MDAAPPTVLTMRDIRLVPIDNVVIGILLSVFFAVETALQRWVQVAIR